MLTKDAICEARDHLSTGFPIERDVRVYLKCARQFGPHDLEPELSTSEHGIDAAHGRFIDSLRSTIRRGEDLLGAIEEHELGHPPRQ
jgi:hypothetical protein